MNIKKLIQMQNELDSYIAKEKGLGDPYDTKFLEYRKLALLVELGELANATRCFKYWSNKESDPKERILDELADCIHFILSIIILRKVNISYIERNHKEIEFIITNNKKLKDKSIIALINDTFKTIALEKWDEVLLSIMSICIKLEFNLSELEQSYIKKHEVNYKRQQEGY